MGAPRPPYPYRCEGPLGHLRLDLAPAGLAVPVSSPVSGRWSPYSRELTREGAHLVDDFPLDRGRIDRLVYSRGDWTDAAVEVFGSHGRVKAGWFPPGRHRSRVLLRLAGAGTLLLQVDWPDPSEPGALS